MSRFWFSNMNTALKEKRSNEECKLTLNEWSIAKSRLTEDISSKIERTHFASNP